MNKFKISFRGRVIGDDMFSDLTIEVSTPYSFVGNDNAFMAINSAGYECNYIYDIKKI
jgi:hypothetical protein